MNSAVLTMEEAGITFGHESPEGALSFLASRSKSSARTLSPSAIEVFKGCGDAVNQLVRSAVESRSGAEFARVYHSAFPRYVALSFAMSHFASAVVPKPVIERLTRESICEMEADFRDKGVEAFGAAVRDQAVFTVWTLRKISELITQIVAANLDEANAHEDEECRTSFNLNTFRAQFSLDCLNMALRDGDAIYPEVLEKLIDGLRAMVNAYTWARRGLEARVPSEQPVIAASVLSADDRELMEVSFEGASEILNREGA
jgi:hypothetical protein